MISQGRSERVFALRITLPVVRIVGIMFVGRSCKNFGEVLCYMHELPVRIYCCCRCFAHEEACDELGREPLHVVQ